MSYELRKPITEKTRMDFIVEYNHNMGLRIEDTPRYLFALEENEIMGEKEEGGEVIPYPVVDPDWEEKQKEKERQRLNMLFLTKREVFLALYQDKGITPDQLKAQIQNPEALIEFEYANDYYRGNPLIGQIGAMLGYTSDDLDYLFQFKQLPSHEEEENE